LSSRSIAQWLFFIFKMGKRSRAKANRSQPVQSQDAIEGLMQGIAKG
jgi:hypothetical protein